MNFIKISQVAHRDNLWKRMEDIEARGRDPSRLFGNRGCALLLEEKERKKIMKVDLSYSTTIAWMNHNLKYSRHNDRICNELTFYGFLILQINPYFTLNLLKRFEFNETHIS